MSLPMTFCQSETPTFQPPPGVNNYVVFIKAEVDEPGDAP